MIYEYDFTEFRDYCQSRGMTYEVDWDAHVDKCLITVSLDDATATPYWSSVYDETRDMPEQALDDLQAEWEADNYAEPPDFYVPKPIWAMHLPPLDDEVDDAN